MDDTRPSRALWAMAEIRRQIRGRRLGFFLDLDGTLAPLAPRPDLVTVPVRTRAVLGRLAARHLVCFVSGRGLEDLRGRLYLESAYYAADHGHRIVGPEGSGVDVEVGGDCRQALEAAATELREKLSPLEGVVVEAKGLSVSVHFRLVDEDRRPLVHGAVAEVARRFSSLRLTGGRMVHEFRPPGAWDKGQAVLWLLDRLGWTPDDGCPVCLGDDLTDEDMFMVVRDRGVAVAVGDPDRPTEARFRLRDHVEVAIFLEAFATDD